MNTLDVLLVAPIVIGAYTGFKRGFIVGTISLLAVVLGVLGGFYFLNWGVSILIVKFGISGALVPILAFAVIFVGIIILVNLIGKIVKKFVQMILLGGIDKIMGALMGAVIWAFLVSSLIWGAGIFKISFPNYWEEESLLLNYIKPIAPAVASAIDGVIPAFSDSFEKLGDLIDAASP